MEMLMMMNRAKELIEEVKKYLGTRDTETAVAWIEKTVRGCMADHK